MEIFSDLILGFSVALSPFNLLFCFLGAMVGTLIGVLPGIGPLATLAMLLPVTFYLPPTAALITKTSTVRLRVCSRVGQLTFFSSDQASSMKPRNRCTTVVVLLVLRVRWGGRGDRTRTYNPRFWRPVLCQLSYTPAEVLPGYLDSRCVVWRRSRGQYFSSSIRLGSFFLFLRVV